MKNATDEIDLSNTIFAELKHMGVKVPKVKKFKLMVAKQDKFAGKPGNKIFGVTLHEQEWVTGPNGVLPKFIEETTTYLLKFTKVEGLFRKAGSVTRQRKLRTQLENGQDLEGSDANDVASLLKQWLRELPEPLIPHCMQDLFIKCLQLGNKEAQITASLLSALLLPSDHLYTLKHLLCFLQKFATDSSENKMGTYNLALIMAPNLFVYGTETADKNSNNLVPFHTSSVQLLIENADKIGTVPSAVSFYCSLQDGKSGSELDSSTDLLDFSPSKSKKKRKSGQLQDLLSGIKKLVGQSTTPGTSLKMTPEKYANARVCAPKSASKRKADPDNQASAPKSATKRKPDPDQISSLIKPPALLINEESGINTTPKTKDSNADCKSAGRHSRRKSFGLLRRKERKRQKSSKPNFEVHISVASAHTRDLVTGEPAVQDSPVSNERPETLSPFRCTFEDFLKSVPIKKTTSDCCLTPALRKFSKSPKPTSISHSRLQDKRQATSPYWLRSISPSRATDQSCTPKQHSQENKLAGVEKVAVCAEVIQSNPQFEVGTNINMSDDVSQKEVKNATPEEKKGSKETFQCSLLSESLYGVTNSTRKRSYTTGSRLTRRAGITRQEAFIIKSKNKIDFAESEIENKENNKDSSVRCNESVLSNAKTNSNHVDKGASVINLYRNGSSLVRGKPNSVKTGLLSHSLKNKPVLSGLDASETAKSLCKDKIDSNEVNFSVQYSPLIDDQVHGEVDTSDKNLSLITKFDSFCISPNASTECLDANLGPPRVTKVSSDRKLRSSPSIFVEKTRKSKRKSSLPLSLDVVPCDADRKIPKLSFLETCKTSFISEEQKDSELQGSCDLDASGCFKMPAPSGETTLNFSNFELSMNDSCFKTPQQNPTSSSNSINWVSGPKFFGFDSPEEEEDNFNKRESIALILKNKSGHVQEKVNLYDNRIRDSIYCTRRVQSCSTPYIAFSTNRNSPHVAKSPFPTPRQLRDLHKPVSQSKSYDSNHKRNQIKGKPKSQKSPLPPPPKFVITDLDASSPQTNHPLKEVTNICLGLDESTNSQNNTPGKNEVKGLKKSPLNDSKTDPSPKPKKLKRNSFSSHAPRAKRVSRSESSPCRPRPSKKQSGVVHLSASLIRNEL